MGSRGEAPGKRHPTCSPACGLSPTTNTLTWRCLLVWPRRPRRKPTNPKSGTVHPPGKRGSCGGSWLNPSELDTQCWQPGTCGEHPIIPHSNPHSEPVEQILAPSVKARKPRLKKTMTTMTRPSRISNIEVQGFSTLPSHWEGVVGRAGIGIELLGWLQRRLRNLPSQDNGGYVWLG